MPNATTSPDHEFRVKLNITKDMERVFSIYMRLLASLPEGELKSTVRRELLESRESEKRGYRFFTAYLGTPEEFVEAVLPGVGRVALPFNSFGFVAYFHRVRITSFTEEEEIRTELENALKKSGISDHLYEKAGVRARESLAGKRFIEIYAEGLSVEKREPELVIPILYRVGKQAVEKYEDPGAAIVLTPEFRRIVLRERATT